MPSTPSRTARPVLAAFALFALLAILLAAAAARPDSAAAGGPGKWTAISAPVGSLLVQPAAARGAGGVLHVVWADSGTPDFLRYRQVTAAGVAGLEQTLTPGGWDIVNDPAVITEAGGTRVLVFSGSQNPGASISGLAQWVSSDGGASFTPGALVTTAGSSWASEAGAVAIPGSVLETWANANGVFTHRGEIAGTTYDVNDVGAFGYDSAFGYDAVSGQLYVVAFYNATGKAGLWARAIDPATGAAMAPSFTLQKSWTDYSGVRSAVQQNTRTPVVGLTGRSVVVVAYPVGYPTATTLRVWRLTPSGQSTSVLAAGGSEKGATAVAADPDGRAWVVWTDESGTRRRVYAARSNAGATAWGQVVSLTAPAGATTLWQLAASAQSDRVDVLAQYDSAGGNEIFHSQLLAGLTVKVSPAKVKVGTTVTVKVKVLDAGVAVAGAKATIAGKSSTTSAAGVAKIKVKATKAGKLTVGVKKSGYAKGIATLKVVR